MEETASRVSRVASGRSQSIEGSSCIAASEAYSVFLLPPIVGKLRQEYAGISVEMVASNAATDLLRREADIAIRHVASSQPDLITQAIGNDEVYFTPHIVTATRSAIPAVFPYTTTLRRSPFAKPVQYQAALCLL
ncbi:LysR family transcriptional regulator substrate-binding protein [Sphingorhabdus pulchriflava]|uniref:LysR family transcriptional regulator substrate-binding protein n=1 Tax=Sphingorhabdus pulchriflava TaxID=2292257 RepID=UPI001C69BFD2